MLDIQNEQVEPTEDPALSLLRRRQEDKPVVPEPPLAVVEEEEPEVTQDPSEPSGLLSEPQGLIEPSVLPETNGSILPVQEEETSESPDRQLMLSDMFGETTEEEDTFEDTEPTDPTKTPEENALQSMFGQTDAEKQQDWEEDAERRVVQEYSLAGDGVHVLRKALQGVSNVPDMGLHILSMMNSVEIKENPDYPAVPSDSPLLQAIMDISNINPAQDVLSPMVDALAEWSQFALKEGLSVSHLTDMLVPTTTPESEAGKWVGVAAEGAAESLTVGLKMATHAKKLKNLDSIPKFIKPMYEALRKDPKLILKQEVWSGAFAALTGTGAAEWYLENYDNPDLAPLVGFIAGAAGGSIKDPLVVPKVIGGTTKSTGLVIGKVTRSGARKVRELIGASVDKSDAMDEFFNNHTYGKILKSSVDFVAGKETKSAAFSMLEEAENSPVLKQMIMEITDTINITDSFADQLKVARKAQGSIDDLVLTTANVSEDAVDRGLTKDYGEIDPKASLKAHKQNVAAVKKFYEKTFAEGSPEDIIEVQRAAERSYAQTVEDSHVTVRAVERVLDDIILAEGGGTPSSQGKLARAKLEDLKAMYGQLKNQLYDIDPMNQIKVKMGAFKDLLGSPEFDNLDPTNVTGNKVRTVMGAALAKTLNTRLKSGDIQLGQLNLDPDIAKSILKRVASGDKEAMRLVPKKLRELYYQDADQMLRDLNTSAADLKELTAGGGSAHRTMSGIAKRAEQDFVDGMGAVGASSAVEQRRAAQDFYGLYLGGYFDPKGTATAKLLKNKSHQVAAVANEDALQSIFKSADEMEKFMELTDVTKVGSVLQNPEASAFGKWLKNDVNMDVSTASPEVMDTLRKTMESHVIASAQEAMKRGRDNPREALKNWMDANNTSLDHLPELKRILEESKGSPTLGHEALGIAMAERADAKRAVARERLQGIFGQGSFGKNALNILADPQASFQVNALLDTMDDTGKLRATFVNGAIRDVLKPDSRGVINAEQVHNLLEKHGAGLRSVASKETMDALEDLAEATKIIRRGDVSLAGVNHSVEGSQSWIVKEIPKMWTTLRTRETLGVNRTRLGLIHAGSYISGRALKLDNKAQEMIGEIYAAILSDPDVAAEFTEAALDWKKATTAVDRAAADERIGALFAGLGMPITAIPTGFAVGSEVVEDIDIATEEAKAELEAEGAVFDKEDRGVSGAVEEVLQEGIRDLSEPSAPAEPKIFKGQDAETTVTSPSTPTKEEPLDTGANAPETPITDEENSARRAAALKGKAALSKAEEIMGRPLESWEKLIIKEEGYSDKPYKDSKDVWTRGFGQTKEFFDMDIEEVLRIHKEKTERLVNNLDEYPEKLRDLMISSVYRGGLSGSKNTLDLINAGEFAKASKEFLDHKGYRKAAASGSGVATRMRALSSALMEHSKRNGTVNPRALTSNDTDAGSEVVG